MTVPIFFATIVIIAGIWLLSHRGGSLQKIRFRYILYPLSASLLAGVSQVLRKFGLAAIPHPFLAAAVTATSSFAVSLLIVLISEKRRATFLLNKECLPFYLAAGVAVSLGMVTIRSDRHLLVRGFAFDRIDFREEESDVSPQQGVPSLLPCGWSGCKFGYGDDPI